uniref:Nuclear cap-binding protein subunit 3 n=1 Tax=Gouania willdenowi TaxID=441366 RepID=A0A8C5EG37_GOUWI
MRSLKVSLNTHSDSGSECSSGSDPDPDPESDREARDSEPMEVEEGELEVVPVNCSIKELLPDTSRRYENKAGAFITGIDVNSKEAIERKEKRARRFHFRGEESINQRDVLLDKDTIKKDIPSLRLEAIHVSGVDHMSTQDVFGFFKEFPPAHIEWIDDNSCNVVWLDDDSCIRALISTSRVPDPETVASVIEGKEGKEAQQKNEETSEEKNKEKAEGGEVDHTLILANQRPESLLSNAPRVAIRPFKGNKLLLRFATQDDKKELGAARRSRYYMKYGNPNYGGMKGILSNSWKRRFHTRRIHRDVIKTKKPLIGDSMGHTPPYTHRHSADLVNLPEEPIKEEEEEEEGSEEEMEADDRLVEFRGRDSDEMDYDLELKMISTPSPRKSKKMSMYADELESHLKIQLTRTKSSSPSPSKVTDVRQLLEEKRQTRHRPTTDGGKTDVRQRLGKRRFSPDERSPSPPAREPIRDVHRRLGVASQDRKTGACTHTHTHWKLLY